VIYLKTRPDITYTVNKLCKFMKAPGSDAIVAAKRLLRYLKGTLGTGLCFGTSNIDASPMLLKSEPELHRFNSHFQAAELYACADAAFADQHYSGKSTFGFVLFFNGAVLVQKSKEHASVMASTVAAEYVALAEAGRTVKALQQIFDFFGHTIGGYAQWGRDAPVPMYGDNQGANTLAHRRTLTDKSRVILVRYHQLREWIERGEMEVIYVKTQWQLADGLTKGLGPQRHWEVNTHLVDRGQSLQWG